MKFLSILYLSTLPVFTQELLEPVMVYGKAETGLEEVDSATKGAASSEELSQRPFLRRGELLEVIPGMIVTQHAGGGKANQYFVRGFNLDHGTDFHIGLDGMPANYRNHAHGQGYADINFIVPEFVDHLDYFKGPFTTAYGDLSTAGGADYSLFNVLPGGIASVTYGEYDFTRLLLADSWELENGSFSAGVEYTHQDGPWERGNNYDRYNLFARYFSGDEDHYFSITALAHRGDWGSSDQVPKRALESDLIGRFGAIDDSTGGETQRHSLSARWQRSDGKSTTHLDAWVGYYDLELYSNFTYFLNDPIRGDQFEQSESRVFTGLHLWNRRDYELAGKESQTTVGFQTRHDFVDDIGLYLTQNRERFDTVRTDDLYTGSFSVYADHQTQVTDWFRAGVGLRGDLFYFDVDNGIGANSGSETDAVFSPKLNLTFGPWAETEFYVNAGYGFHSNDARGVISNVDPADPLVRTKGAEIGLRTERFEDLSATLSLWYIESDSELVYVGDAGTTEAGNASERWGIEAAAYWRPTEWFTADLEYSYSDARFTDAASGFDYIPNSVDHALSAGFTVGEGPGWFGSLRARYFAPRPLEESGEIKSDSSFLMNARVGYRRDDWEISVDVLNLLDRDNNDIEYFYESRLPGEVAGVEGTHVHPMEPRQVRVNMTYRF